METINGTVFKGMLLSGSCNLNNRKKEVDALNVFPVPDGDTGTNMSMNSEQKQSVMKRFAEGSIGVLVSTTVVEVGMESVFGKGCCYELSIRPVGGYCIL